MTPMAAILWACIFAFGMTVITGLVAESLF